MASGMAQTLEQRWRGKASGLCWLRSEAGQPKPGPTPAAQPRLPFRSIVGDFAEAYPSICESGARVPFFLTCLFFCSCDWDTPISRVGHPSRRRQEAARDRVGVDAARTPLARDDALLGKLREMAGHRATRLPCGRGERAD